MKPFSFVHVADLHLGYAQYNLDVRRDDFNVAFQELVDKTIELKPDFMIIAGDIFQQARPSNMTLENAITNFRRLRDVGIPVLAVDGSHDSAPNVITGTILNPLDSAGLVYYLPRHEGASWRNEICYVYGIPNFRTPRKTEEELPSFLEQNKPTPDPSIFNIFVFHMALDIPSVKPPQMEAEARPEILPEGFNYYAGGHVHKPYKLPFKGGLLVYSGCTETVSYEDAETEKGFYHVEVNEKGVPKLHHVKLETPRRFIVLDRDYGVSTPMKVTEAVVQLVKEADETGAVLVPIVRGVLPAGAGRGEFDLAKIRSAAEKALLVHPLLRLRETEVPEEVIRSIFEGGLKDLKTKAFEYFFEIFSERYPQEEAEKIARLAVDLIEPLVGKQETKVKKVLEEVL
ncbi:MAG: DNA double-strand break repair protein Mre11 [Candidatus Bathyarchaeota archaeon BA2]|nr:MAG: DNA double-strand break repair protein Mre11 [Candidatus Bathyarchaeota archaeon BA2]